MTDATSSRSYHWILTLGWHTPQGQRVEQTGHGVIDVEPGETREAVYKEITEEARREMGVSDAVSVVFFALEPNDLPVH